MRTPFWQHVVNASTAQLGVRLPRNCISNSRLVLCSYDDYEPYERPEAHMGFNMDTPARMDDYGPMYSGAPYGHNGSPLAEDDYQNYVGRRVL